MSNSKRPGRSRVRTIRSLPPVIFCVTALVAFSALLSFAAPPAKPPPAASSTPARSANGASQASEQLRQAQDQVRQLLMINKALQQNLAQANSPLNRKYIDAKVAYYDYQIRMMKAAEALYDWQQTASTVILILVVILVTAGVIFSGFQLWQAVKGGAPQASTELELSATRFHVTSSVVGILVLTISLAFSYLFITRVYTIYPAPAASQEHSQKK